MAKKAKTTTPAASTMVRVPADRLEAWAGLLALAADKLRSLGAHELASVVAGESDRVKSTLAGR